MNGSFIGVTPFRLHYTVCFGKIHGAAVLVHSVFHDPPGLAPKDAGHLAVAHALHKARAESCGGAHETHRARRRLVADVARSWMFQVALYDLEPMWEQRPVRRGAVLSP